MGFDDQGICKGFTLVSKQRTNLTTNNIPPSAGGDYIGHVNIKRLQEEILEGMSVVSSSANKEIVVLIGDSGAGKSTSTNYLLGCKMRAEYTDTGPVIKAENEIAKIGHTTLAETK